MPRPGFTLQVSLIEDSCRPLSSRTFAIILKVLVAFLIDLHETFREAIEGIGLWVVLINREHHEFVLRDTSHRVKEEVLDDRAFVPGRQLRDICFEREAIGIGVGIFAMMVKFAIPFN